MFSAPKFLDVSECYLLYEMLKPWASSWLDRGDFQSPLHLARWARAENAFLVQNGHEFVVIVTAWYPGLKATLHPLFQTTRMFHNTAQARDITLEFADLLQVQRLELNIGTRRTYSVKRLAKRLDFTYEGTLRCANRLADGDLEDLEIWSWLRPKE